MKQTVSVFNEDGFWGDFYVKKKPLHYTLLIAVIKKSYKYCLKSNDNNRNLIEIIYCLSDILSLTLPFVP